MVFASFQSCVLHIYQFYNLCKRVYDLCVLCECVERSFDEKIPLFRNIEKQNLLSPFKSLSTCFWVVEHY